MLKLEIATASWPLHVPFAISRGTQTEIDTVMLTLTDAAGHRGRAETIGVDYAGETIDSIIAAIEAVRPAIEAGLGDTGLALDAVQRLLPAGGARNGLDCALWDLAAKRSGVPAWQAAGVADWRPQPTAFTLGIMAEASLRSLAAAHAGFSLLKVKTNRELGRDPARIVHECAPDARIILDPNEAWGEADLRRHAPHLLDLNIALLEQPVDPRDDACLERIRLPVPVAADEAFADRSSLDALVGRYDVINIKLDKTGGLTEALAAARAGRARGFELMIGCMAGSSLSMAPAMIVAQLCRFVDLDGPLLQSGDVADPILYAGGMIHPPTAALWG